MKKLNSIWIMSATLWALSCGSPGTGQGNKGSAETQSMANRPKTFKSAAEAGKAAKADMLAAIEQKVDFGVDAERLRAAEPGTEISIMTLDPALLMTADTGVHLERLAKSEGNLLVPFQNNEEVNAVAFLNNNEEQFKITGLGDKFLTAELNMVYELNRKLQGSLSILQVENLNATVYLIRNTKGEGMTNQRNTYVLSSYNGHNLREPLNERELISTLAKDARVFMEQHGAQLKKGKLVR